MKNVGKSGLMKLGHSHIIRLTDQGIFKIVGKDYKSISYEAYSKTKGKWIVKCSVDLKLYFW
jgi:hypothetical protein